MRRLDVLDHRNRVALSTVSQSVANLLAAGLGIVGIHLAAASLGPDRYGAFVTVVSFVTLFTILNDLGINAVGTRELARRPEDARLILGDNLVLRSAMSLVLMPLVTGLAMVAYPDRRGTVVVGVALMSTDMLLTAVQTTVLTYFAARVRNDVAALVVLLGKVTYVGLIVAAGAVGTSFLGYVAAFVAGDVLATTVAVVAMARRIRPALRVDLRRWRTIIATSFPLGLLQVFATAYFWNGSIVLSLFRDSKSVAFYGIAVNVLLLVAATSGYFMTALVPAMARADAGELQHVLQSAFDIVVVLAAPVAVGGFLLRAPLVTAFAGHRFAGAASPFGVLVVAAAITMVNNIFGYAAIALDKPRALVQVQLPILALNVGVGIVVAPRFGTTGEAVVLLGCEVISCVAIFHQFTRAAGVRLAVVKDWKVAAAAVAMVPVAAVAASLWRTHLVYLDAVVGVAVLGSAYLGVLVGVHGMPSALGDLAGAAWRRARGGPPPGDRSCRRRRW